MNITHLCPQTSCKQNKPDTIQLLPDPENKTSFEINIRGQSLCHFHNASTSQVLISANPVVKAGCLKIFHPGPQTVFFITAFKYTTGCIEETFKQLNTPLFSLILRPPLSYSKMLVFEISIV